MEKPIGAIENAKALILRIENEYDFICQAGHISLCADWVELQRCLSALEEYVISAK